MGSSGKVWPRWTPYSLGPSCTKKPSRVLLWEARSSTGLGLASPTTRWVGRKSVELEAANVVPASNARRQMSNASASVLLNLAHPRTPEWSACLGRLGDPFVAPNRRSAWSSTEPQAERARTVH